MMFTNKLPTLGKMTSIQNQNAHFNADNTYHYVKVLIGKEEQDLLLTDTDMDKAIHRANKNKDDIDIQVVSGSMINSKTVCLASYAVAVTVGLVAMTLFHFFG